MVEGGARGEGFHRLQPKRARPDDRGRVLRAGQAGATVSTPVTWDELAAVETKDFTIESMPERFAKSGDLQAGIDDAGYDLRKIESGSIAKRRTGLGEAPYPPNFPKMAGEPKRVQPSRAKKKTTE